jgi:uncharacterized protein (TIGR03083 family)
MDSSALEVAAKRGHERHIAAADTEVTRLLTAAHDADLPAPVPGCPGWTIADLLKHVGGTHRWVDTIVGQRRTSVVRFRDLVLDRPDDPAEYIDWVARGAQRLWTTLRAAHPDAPVWAWGADQHVRFWSRRMWHEALVHRLDAQRAVGETLDLAPADGLDCIDEFLTNLPHAPQPSRRLPELAGAGQTIHLHATDAAGEWLLTLQPNEFAWQRGHAKGDVAVRGKLLDLVLLVYGRIAPTDGRYERFGDSAPLERWLAAAKF